MRAKIDNLGVSIVFADKPPADILAALKANGFRWSPVIKAWQRQRVTGAADLIAALYRMLNPNRPDGDCWKCGAPGKFRRYGAATPVYCDACHAVHEQHRISPYVVKGGAA